MLGEMLRDLSEVDAWLDKYVGHQYSGQPLAQDWARISKVAEELGEAIQAFISATGQNPRKPCTDDLVPVLDELCDTSITAILAMLHFTKDPVLVGRLLGEKVRKICVRMGEDKTRRHREEARNSPDALRAQRAWLDANIT